MTAKPSASPNKATEARSAKSGTMQFGPTPVGGPRPARKTAPGRKRQWGADKRTTPLPPVAPPATDRQITLGRLGIVFTLLAWSTYILVTVLSQFVNRGFQA